MVLGKPRRGGELGGTAPHLEGCPHPLPSRRVREPLAHFKQPSSFYVPCTKDNKQDLSPGDQTGNHLTGLLIVISMTLPQLRRHLDSSKTQDAGILTET